MTAGQFSIQDKASFLFYSQGRIGDRQKEIIAYNRSQMTFVEKLARSAQYGSADFSSSLLRRIGTFIPGEDIFDENFDYH